jgi:hypothetical protein
MIAIGPSTSAGAISQACPVPIAAAKNAAEKANGTPPYVPGRLSRGRAILAARWRDAPNADTRPCWSHSSPASVCSGTLQVDDSFRVCRQFRLGAFPQYALRRKYGEASLLRSVQAYVVSSPEIGVVPDLRDVNPWPRSAHSRTPREWG